MSEPTNAEIMELLKQVHVKLDRLEYLLVGPTSQQAVTGQHHSD